MKFKLSDCLLPNGIKIQGLYEIQPQLYTDDRGFFLEYYNQKDFYEAGLTMKFVQDNHSKSSYGVLRGLHFQKENTQGKLIRIIHGKVYDVVVDLRKNSESFGRYFGIILDSEKQNMLYVPKGFAHGFLVLSESAETIYECSDFYNPSAESGIDWQDPMLAINWSDYINLENIILSEKDKKNPPFDKSKNYFDLDGKWIGLH